MCNLCASAIALFLGGIRDMKSMPQALFVVDPRKERNAIAEAHKLHIPIRIPPKNLIKRSYSFLSSTTSFLGNTSNKPSSSIFSISEIRLIRLEIVL
jgi:hypothetical protein